MMKFPWVAKLCLFENYCFRGQVENVQVVENISPSITLEGKLLSLLVIQDASICMCMHMHVNGCMCTCVYMYVHVCAYVYVHAWAFVLTCLPSLCPPVCPCPVLPPSLTKTAGVEPTLIQRDLLFTRLHLQRLCSHIKSYVPSALCQTRECEVEQDEPACGQRSPRGRGGLRRADLRVRPGISGGSVPPFLPPAFQPGHPL